MNIHRETLKKLRNTVARHPKFEKIIESVLAQVQYGSTGNILNIIGPTGVGKTTLIRYAAHLLNQFVDKNPDCGYGHAIIIQAHAPERGSFNWTAFYRRALMDFGEPALDAKVVTDHAVEALKAGQKIQHGISNLTTTELRELFLKNVRYRRPIAIFIDEAQHLTICSSAERKSANLDVLKGLSNEGMTNYILSGTYEARKMLYHGGQLSRRIRILHFSRYAHISQDYEAFENLFSKLVEQHHIPISKDVQKKPLFVYNHTLGCSGILISWLTSALELTLQRGKSCISLAELQETRLSNLQLESISREIAQFENEHKSKADFDPAPFFNIVLAKPDQPDKPTTARLPGHRYPKRDQVGDSTGKTE